MGGGKSIPDPAPPTPPPQMEQAPDRTRRDEQGRSRRRPGIRSTVATSPLGVLGTPTVVNLTRTGGQ